MQNEVVQWFGAIGSWAAAFATLFTAFVALRIASKNDRLNLSVSATDAVQFGDGPKEEIVWVSIANTGRRRAVVRNVGWSFRSPKKQSFVQKIDFPNKPLPISLDDGDQVDFTWPVHRESYGNWYSRFAKELDKVPTLFRWYAYRTFRIEVFCSTGDSFSSRPSQHFLERIFQASANGAKATKRDKKA